MLDELVLIANFIDRARCPEDVFGNLGAIPALAVLDVNRKHFIRVLHPDKYQASKELEHIAATAFQRMERFYEVAKEKIIARTYGDREPMPELAPVIIKGKYERSIDLCSGDIADLHLGHFTEKGKLQNCILKVGRQEQDNVYLRAERDALRVLADKLPSASWANAVPKVYDSFTLVEAGASPRWVNVLEAFDGFMDVNTIRDRLPQVDMRDIVWMWRRLLIFLDWIHHIGYTHGAILPPHLMFYPDNDGKTGRDVRKHSIRVVDWCYSVPVGGRPNIWVPAYKDFYPPEVVNKGKTDETIDLYMGAKCMIYMLDGDVKTNWVPSKTDTKLMKSILRCVDPDPKKRPKDAKKYHDEFGEIATEVYGPRKWHNFEVPA